MTPSPDLGRRDPAEFQGVSELEQRVAAGLGLAPSVWLRVQVSNRCWRRPEGWGDDCVHRWEELAGRTGGRLEEWGGARSAGLGGAACT